MLQNSSFRHVLFYILCRIGLLDDEVAARLEFEWMVLGLKFALLNRTLCRRVLRRKYVKALLPDNLEILLKNATTDILVLAEILLERIYEKHYHPKSGDTVFDIGSHVGIFTVKASRLVGSSGVVYAFEPEPENFMLLKRNVALNRALNVKTFNKAVSSQNGMLYLYVHPIETTWSSVQYAKEGTIQMSVPSITLDQIMQNDDIQEVDLLKIDVEGHELEVLRGANRFLDICKHIAMETHEREGGPPNSQITEALKEHGFKVQLVRYSDFDDMLYGWK